MYDHAAAGIQVDPFASDKRFWPSLINALLATALFRCWHILFLFALWSTMVSLITRYVHNLTFQPTLLTVIGTVLGFVISYRTTSSFERYNEGRRLWSQIILNSRTFARIVWFHVPDMTPENPTEPLSPEQRISRTLVEKKTVINLLEGYGVSVKHYLRGEEGIFYEDLYHLVKFLPDYALPNAMTSVAEIQSVKSRVSSLTRLSFNASRPQPGSNEAPTEVSKSPSAPHLPLPASTPGKQTNFLKAVPRISVSEAEAQHPRGRQTSTRPADDLWLLPARMPPKYTIFDLFPFSLLGRLLIKRGVEVKGQKAARMRAKLGTGVTNHNIPLQISLYLSSYVAALQKRKALDPPTATALLASLTALVDALTGLERILTTPIPFSYSIHLWAVTVIYCLFLPFQIWNTMKWLTIPGTTIAAFIFFGFLVAGEEIENPFGYDKNDLNMDYFTHVIIHNELRGLTANSTPDLSEWAFSPDNDQLFYNDTQKGGPIERVSPAEWVNRGVDKIRGSLAGY